ncbi:hypothetical protein [Mucilaginibacter sp.]|uniref:hypothetical protein n=1 Tax=Mucilaginibacter sp. TaxID=1882438 RepID=UPI003B001018
MGLFSKIFNKPTFDKNLEGVWISDIKDEATISNIGNVLMTFTNNGKLIYEIMDGDKLQRINMVYWTSGDTLYSDQPSSPKQESTKYMFDNEDTLVLEFGGDKTKFKRQ